MQKKMFIFVCCALAVAFYCQPVCQAEVTCTVDTGDSGWVDSNPGGWDSGVYTLGVTCTDGGEPVQGQIVEFTGAVHVGIDYENDDPVSYITVRSSPTDAYGNASIVIPLMHEPVDTEGTVVHLCPFDDIACSGSVVPINARMSAPQPAFFTTSPCSWLPGCCQITVTIHCPGGDQELTSFCTMSTQEMCAALQLSNPFITIASVYDAEKTCNYCDGECQDANFVTLASFTARPGNGSVTISWETEAEIDNQGFNVYRAESADGDYVKINATLIPAEGTVTRGAQYSIVDTDVQNRTTYYYLLEDVDFSGVTTPHGPERATPRLIHLFR